MGEFVGDQKGTIMTEQYHGHLFATMIQLTLSERPYHSAEVLT